MNHTEYMRQYRRNHPEYIEYGRKYNKEYRKQNNEHIKEYNRIYNKMYRENYKEEIKEYKKIWYQNNKKRLLEKQKVNNKKRRKIDIKYNLNCRISRALHHSLKGNKNGIHCENILGYTIGKLKNHLERTLPKGYDWQDFLNGKLHIDHIIPISVWNFTKPEHPDFKRCWALENLQLLPAKENYIKKNKLIKPFQPSLKLFIEKVVS